MSSSLVQQCLPAKCFMLEARRSQIRRTWRIINQFNETVAYSSHCNHSTVCRSIDLVKQDPLKLFSSSSDLISFPLISSWSSMSTVFFASQKTEAITLPADKTTLIWNGPHFRCGPWLAPQYSYLTFCTVFVQFVFDTNTLLRASKHQITTEVIWLFGFFYLPDEAAGCRFPEHFI